MSDDDRRDVAHGELAGATARLARWGASLQLDDVDDATLAHAKRTVLDTLAVALAGTRAEGADVVERIAASRAPDGPCTQWGTARRTGLLDAALLNGIAAAALDYDAVHDRATVHAGIVLLPALLALAEARRSSGPELLAAYVAGSEVLTRMGLAMRSHPGWFYTSVLGPVAAALACARLIGLDASGAQRAMGVALSRCAGTQQPLVEKSFTKRMQSAFAARDGLECALLAECGVSAPGEALEGRFAIATLYAPMDAHVLEDALGRRYHAADACLKAYPSCLCNHAAIAAALAVREAPGIAAAGVGYLEAVEVRITAFMDRLVGGAFRPGASPQVAAQFSVRYSVAAALLHGTFDLRALSPVRIDDPAVRALAGRIALHVDRDDARKFAPATVTVRTADARSASHTAHDYPGAPGRPLDDAQLRDKVRDCLASVPSFGAARAERLVERTLALERLDDASAWCTELRAST